MDLQSEFVLSARANAVRKELQESRRLNRWQWTLRFVRNQSTARSVARAASDGLPPVLDPAHDIGG
jgi:hypothetical protein